MNTPPLTQAEPTSHFDTPPKIKVPFNSPILPSSKKFQNPKPIALQNKNVPASSLKQQQQQTSVKSKLPDKRTKPSQSGSTSVSSPTSQPKTIEQPVKLAETSNARPTLPLSKSFKLSREKIQKKIKKCPAQ